VRKEEQPNAEPLNLRVENSVFFAHFLAAALEPVKSKGSARYRRWD